MPRPTITRGSVKSNPSGKLPAYGQWFELTRRPIMRLTHARSRYIYDLYYKRELISRELYDWLLKQKYADAE
jgi:bud site selection protein 31